ncbi:response regulator [Winogradskyella sp.]|uniref:response regulator n=1 Tax=Winogradskyella sp. TaxID=1883156 RepID=UPI00260ECDBD|nr:response regulator [Winogradskyella sp.]
MLARRLKLKSKTKVLIVDDHPIIADGYKNALSYGIEEEIVFDLALNCQEAVLKISTAQEQFDIIFLDINLPSYKKMRLYSGEDLGIWIREHYPEIKLLVLTCHNDELRLNEICESLSPEGFLIKSEATSVDVVSAFKDIKNGKIALGPRVSQVLLHRSEKKIHLDDIDIKILKELSNGTKTIDLPKYVPLSKSGIEKRKRQLKQYFNKISDTDRELILSARKRGYL